MKILAPLENMFTAYVLTALNLAIILALELVGGGVYFAESGLVHALAIIFVVLIIIRIFTDYAFSDYILRGFLRIQLAFFLFLGMVHVYEYFGDHLFNIREDVIELTVMASYFIWILGILLATEFVFRIYYKRSVFTLGALYVLVGACLVGLVAPNISDTVVAWFPMWFPKLILLGITTMGIGSIFSIRMISEIMPVFRDFSNYAVSSVVLLIAASFSEYFEAFGSLESIGISEVQNLYISHILVYVALSLLLIGFGKLKKPTGIYADM